MSHVTGLCSVIVPTYNRMMVLKQALMSVAKQTYHNIEVIVVDDASSDATESVVRNLFESNKHIQGTYIKQEKLGANVARNKGLEAAQGEFVQFLDSDDYLHMEKLQRSIAVFETTNADVVVARSARCTTQAEIDAYVEAPPTYVEYNRNPMKPPFICRPKWTVSAPVFSKNVVELVGGFDNSLNGCQEFEFHARIKCVTQNIVHMPYVMDFYRQNSADMMTKQSPSTRINARYQAAQRIRQHLSVFDIADREEWYALGLHYLRTAYRALTINDNIVADKAIRGAKLALRNANGKGRCISMIPGNAILGALVVRNWYRRSWV